MKAADVTVSALAEWNGKALKKAQKDVGVFDKTVKNLAKTFAGVFAASKLLSYSKNAVNAFIADEKAAKALEVQLSNLGYSFSAPGVELYISNLQKMYGVLDDQLRPAFQSLITASGSLTQSQKALDVALNVSAATGKSVEEVSAALAKGFSGQTTALSRLGAGLDKATLASGDMDKILNELNKKFAGQAAARLDTYAGKMDALKVASENAKEIIGEGLIKSIEALAGTSDIKKITSQMESFATEVSFAIQEVSKLLGLLSKPIIGGKGVTDILGEILFPGGNPFRVSERLRNRDKAPKSAGFTYSLGTNATKEIAAAQARLTEIKNLKERNRINAQLLAQDKAKAALNELSKKFDTERIGLNLALNNATDEETKLRIKAQLALLDQNDVLAKKYNAELDAANAAKKLAESANDAANSLRNVYENAPNYGAFRESPYLPQNLSMTANVPSTGTGSAVQNNYFEIKTAGPILAQDDFTDQVQKAMQQIVTNGYITAPAGFL